MKTVAMRFTFPDGEEQEHWVPYPLLDVVKLVQKRERDGILFADPAAQKVASSRYVLFRLVRFADSTGREWAEYHLDSQEIIALAREVPISALRAGPRPGQLVVDPSMIRRGEDDAVGWLVAHGDAPYNKDGTGELREIWDVIPLAHGRDGKPLRWENAEFYALPDSLAALLK